MFETGVVPSFQKSVDSFVVDSFVVCGRFICGRFICGRFVCGRFVCATAMKLNERQNDH